MKKRNSLRRVFAYIIDWFLSLLLYSFIALFYYSIVTQLKATQIDFHNLSLFEGSVIMCICFVVYVLYFVMIPIINKGQTIGKKLCHLKVIYNDSLLKTCILRVLCLLLIEGFVFYPSFVLIQFIECYMNENLASILYQVSIAITFLSCLVYMFKNKFIHDYVSHSQVIVDEDCIKG